MAPQWAWNGYEWKKIGYLFFWFFSILEVKLDTCIALLRNTKNIMFLTLFLKHLIAFILFFVLIKLEIPKQYILIQRVYSFFEISVQLSLKKINLYIYVS